MEIRYLDAFNSLSLSRRIGMAVGAIPISDIASYCEIAGYTPGRERVEFLRMIQAMDAAWMNAKSDDDDA